MSQAPSRPARRKFLFAAGTTAGVTGAAAIAAALPSANPPPAADAAERRASAGYAESAHIRNYYRTTRI